MAFLLAFQASGSPEDKCPGPVFGLWDFNLSVSGFCRAVRCFGGFEG